VTPRPPARGTAEHGRWRPSDELPVPRPSCEQRREPAPGERLPALVLGGSGYVGGELLRLLAGHPRCGRRWWSRTAAPASPSRRPSRTSRGACRGWTSSRRADLPAPARRRRGVAGFCAAPHGAAAPLLDAGAGRGGGAGCELPLVDMSADFRFADAADWERVYGKPHGAPGRLAAFACGVPELLDGTAGTLHVAHPGCFTTATLLAAVPLVKPAWWNRG
jgi:N-acetyl-gamma-glutamylphosphate reductase